MCYKSERVIMRLVEQRNKDKYPKNGKNSSRKGRLKERGGEGGRRRWHAWRKSVWVGRRDPPSFYFLSSKTRTTSLMAGCEPSFSAL